jgi:hypothetical protein
LAAGIAFMTAGVLGCHGVAAVEFKDLAGKWCTTGGTEQFDRKNLIAIPTGTNDRRIYPIVRFDFNDTTVTVVWKDKSDGESHTTEFGEFSADRRRMVQLPNEKGPRREFRRC